MLGQGSCPEAEAGGARRGERGEEANAIKLKVGKEGKRGREEEECRRSEGEGGLEKEGGERRRRQMVSNSLDMSSAIVELFMRMNF